VHCVCYLGVVAVCPLEASGLKAEEVCLVLVYGHRGETLHSEEQRTLELNFARHDV